MSEHREFEHREPGHREPGHRDPIDDLRALWNGLEAPEPDHSDAPRDARTDAAVDWMRATWGRIEAPPAEVPFVLRRRRVVRRATLLAVAAALLAGLSILIGDRPDLGQAPTAPHDPRVADVTAHAPGLAPGPAPVIERDERVLDVIPDDDHTRTAIDADGRLTLSRGSVQLVWVKPNESPSSDPARERETKENR